MGSQSKGFSQAHASIIVPGGSAGSPLPQRIEGLQNGDTLVAVRHVSDGDDLTTNADVLSDASISGHEEVTLATTDTSGDFVLVVWLKEV